MKLTILYGVLVTLVLASQWTQNALYYCALALDTDNEARDAAAFDQAASAAGFDVALINEPFTTQDPTGEFVLRRYRDPAACDFRLYLRRLGKSLLTLVVFDDCTPYRNTLPPAVCAKYARFRSELSTRLDERRIFLEELPPCEPWVRRTWSILDLIP